MESNLDFVKLEAPFGLSFIIQKNIFPKTNLSLEKDFNIITSKMLQNEVKGQYI